MNVLEARRRMLGAGVYKKTVIGNPAIAQGSLARRYPSITMQGWTEQAQYEGKNLFDAAKAKQLDSWIGTGVYRHFDIQLKPNTTYTLFVSQNNMYKGYKEEYDDNFALYLGDSENTADPNECFGNSSSALKPLTFYTFTTTEVPYYINLYVNSWSEENLQIVFDELLVNMMLVEGSGVVPYEPYTGGAPSPSPDYPQEITSAGNWNEETQKYEYGIELTGANLFDREKAADTNNWVSSTTQDGYSDFAIDVAPGQQITFSFPEKLPLGIVMYVSIVSVEDGSIVKWLYHFTVENLIVQQATVTAITDKIFVRCNTSSIETFVSGNPYFQVEYGEERTNFQPYKEQTVLLTSDRPLTKWDRLEKRGGQWGWVYKSKQIILNGTILNIIGNGTWGNIDDYKTIAFYSYINGTNNSQDIGVDMSRAEEALTNQFIYGPVYNSADVNKFTINSSGGYIAFRVDADMLPDWSSEAPSNQPFIDWLDEKEQAGKPVTLLYPTIEETFTPLTASEQEQMNALHTFRPTTVLSNDAGCEMSLTYKTKKSLEVTT